MGTRERVGSILGVESWPYCSISRIRLFGKHVENLNRTPLPKNRQSTWKSHIALVVIVPLLLLHVSIRSTRTTSFLCACSLL